MIEIGWSMYIVTQKIIQLDLIIVILGLARITIIIPTTNEKTTYSWYGDLTDNFYVQAKYSDVEYTNDQDALGGEDFPDVEIRITDSMGGYHRRIKRINLLGGDKYRSANETSATDEILNIKGVLTVGDHEITMGYDTIDKFVSNLFISREDGAYQF